jgi:hypothetical protein
MKQIASRVIRLRVAWVGTKTELKGSSSFSIGYLGTGWTTRRQDKGSYLQPWEMPVVQIWEQGDSILCAGRRTIFLFGIFFVREYGGDVFLRNVSELRRTVRRYILEDRTLFNHRCENLKSYVNIGLCVRTEFRWDFRFLCVLTCGRVEFHILTPRSVLQGIAEQSHATRNMSALRYWNVNAPNLWHSPNASL